MAHSKTEFSCKASGKLFTPELNVDATLNNETDFDGDDPEMRRENVRSSYDLRARKNTRNGAGVGFLSGGATGGGAGTATGAAIGAAVGTVLFPVIGTAVGTVGGAIIGGITGAGVGGGAGSGIGAIFGRVFTKK